METHVNCLWIRQMVRYSVEPVKSFGSAEYWYISKIQKVLFNSKKNGSAP